MRRHLAALCLFALAVPSHAQNFIRLEAPQKTSKLWKISAFVLGGATALDAASSWGRPELNPLLSGPNGRFGSQGIALKSGLAAGTIGIQYFLLRKRPAAQKYAVVSNFAISGFLGVAAASNYKRSGQPSAK